MHVPRNCLRFGALFALGLAATAAVAKVAHRKPHTFEVVSLDKKPLRDLQTFDVPNLGPSNWFLTGFKFEFENGDHRLRSVGVWPAGQKAHTSFADANGDDPYQVTARWSSMPTYWAGSSEKKVAKKTNCKGTCSFPLDPGRWKSPIVLLQGFHFTRPSGDLKLHKIALFGGLHPNQGRQDAWEFVTTFMAENESFEEKNSLEREKLKQSAYAVEITYVTVDVRRCKVRATATGTRAKGQSQLKLRAEPGKKAITGFAFEFPDGGHHLKSWGVELPEEGHIIVTMNDNNFDDEVKAHVNYCVIDQAAAEKGGPDEIGP